MSTTLWQGYIIAIYRKAVEVFTLPTASTPARIVYSWGFPFHVWTATEMGSISRPERRCFLIVPETTCMHILHISTPNAAVSRSSFLCEVESLIYPDSWCFAKPAHRPALGRSTGRVMWPDYIGELSRACPFMTLVSLSVSTHSEDSDITRAIHVDCGSDNADRLPALWGFSQIDFDDEQGLVVVGNIFGELALIDYVPGELEVCAIGPHLRRNSDATRSHFSVSSNADSLLSVVAQLVYKLYQAISAIPTKNTHAGSAYYQLSTEQELIGLPAEVLATTRLWSNEWDRYKLRRSWGGIPGDMHWLLEHESGLVGKVEVLAFHLVAPATLVRVGALCAIICQRCGRTQSCVIRLATPGFLMPGYHHECLRWEDTSYSSNISRSGAWQHQYAFWHSMYKEKKMFQRNRWHEQRDRSGSPALEQLFRFD